MRQILACLLTLFLVSQLPNVAVGQGPEVAATPRAGLLLLRNGHLLSGQITAAGDRYYVVLASGEISVRRDEVDLHCETLEQAYHHKRKGLETTDLEGRLQLVEWCLTHGLQVSAAKELNHALALRPDHPRIGQLERRLKLAQETSKPTPISLATSELPRTDDLDRMVRGMPAGSVAMFAGSIQPLLLNTCATGDCHGPLGQNGFRLLRTGTNRIPTRRLTMRNLASTLEWIDRDEPLESPLLTLATKAHGSQKVPLFVNEQALPYQQLAAWIQLRSVDRPPPPASVDQQSPPLLQYKTMQRAEDSWTSDADLPGEEDFNEPGSAKPAAINSEMPPERPLQHKQHTSATDDPFDPERFNRRYFGAPGLPSVERR